MGQKSSKGPSEAEQRRILHLYMIKQGLANSGKDSHFENLVLEGAGNKSVSYYGALKVLEEVGLLANIRRFAGVGAGAGWAMFLSLGLNPTEIANLNLDNELSYHAKFGVFAFMPNLAQKLGWSPLGKAVKIAQRVLEQRTGKPDLTFKEVLETYGRELCIVATNLTTGSLEYFHPKTTPDVSIVDALVMSATLPGIMKPRYLVRGGQKHYFVDGGVLCNYCIHANDGWYLSMKKEDSFLSRLSGDCKPPFKGYNDKTIGIVTVSPGDGDFGEQAFLRRLQYETVQRPNTKLSKSKGAESESRWQRAVSKDQVQGAGERLLQRLRNANITGQDQITVQDFQRALGEGAEPGSMDDIELLFGQTRDELTQLFEQMNLEREGKVTFEEFMEVAQQQSMALRQHLEGGGTSRNIRNMPDIFRAVMSAVEGNSKRAFLKEIDIIRSVGVNTDYVSALDPLENQDKNFLVAQGDAACIAFLLEYTQQFAPQQQMPIYSALPARQHSTGSVIDPDEMRDYTVPQNLYPTLPPSYASAIGDTDHLQDNIDTNWPTPSGEYNYHPEKNPNMLLTQAQQQMPVQQMPAQPFSAAAVITHDPWGMPHASSSSNSPQVVSQPSHQARVQVLPQSNQYAAQQAVFQPIPQANPSPPAPARIHVGPSTQYNPPMGRVQVLPSANHPASQAQAHIQVLPQANQQHGGHHYVTHQVTTPHPPQHQQYKVQHAPTSAGASHFTVSIGNQGGAPHRHSPVQVQPQSVFNAKQQKQGPVVIRASSPQMQRRQPIAVIQGTPMGSPPMQRRGHGGYAQPKRHQRQLAALQGDQAEVNHIVFVT